MQYFEMLQYQSIAILCNTIGTTPVWLPAAIRFTLLVLIWYDDNNNSFPSNLLIVKKALDVVLGLRRWWHCRLNVPDVVVTCMVNLTNQLLLIRLNCYTCAIQYIVFIVFYKSQSLLLFIFKRKCKRKYKCCFYI